MAISSTSARYELLATANATAEHVSGSFQIGTSSTTVTYDDPPDIAYSLVLQIASGDTLTMDFTSGVVTGTVAGTLQKETATIVAGAGCTSNGDLALVITADGLAGSPLTVNVPLTTASHTTQDLIAAQCRTTLGATAAITDFFTVGGATNTFTLEKLDKEADDATMNALIPTARGVTGDATSDNTTAGVAVSMAYKRSGTVWDATDHEGLALDTATKLYAVLAVGTGSVANVNVTATLLGNDAIEVAPFVLERVNSAGNHPWIADPVAFEASGGDAVVYLDIHAGT